MSEQVMIVASFGTTHTQTCEKNIGAVEQHIAAAFPAWRVARAFSSNMVRAALAKRGTQVDDLPTALEKAERAGARQVAVLPTHLLYGEEHEKLCAQAAGYGGSFHRLQVGVPLLANTADMQAIVRVLAEVFPAGAGRCTVLMGHGTAHYVNPVYAALNYMLAMAGRPDIILGTVEAYPAMDQVLQQLKAGRYRSAVLAPFMLVAGDHAQNDMAGAEADSWKNVLEGQGLQVEVLLKGLGEYAAVRNIYAAHAAALAQ